MKLVIFGLTISSSWGNGHATLWRGLVRRLPAEGTGLCFSNGMCRTTPRTRDLFELPGGGELILYRDWVGAQPAARRHLADADVAMVTSYCPDALAATELVWIPACACGSSTISTRR